MGLADAVVVVALEVAPYFEADPAVVGADPVAVGECSVGHLVGQVVGIVPPVQGLPCTAVAVGVGSCQIDRQHLVNYSPCLQSEAFTNCILGNLIVYVVSLISISILYFSSAPSRGGPSWTAHLQNYFN